MKPQNNRGIKTLENNTKNLQKNRIHLPLLPFLVIFFLSPLLIIVPFYTLTEVNFFLGIFLFLLIICLPIPLYILISIINKKRDQRKRIIRFNSVFGLILSLLVFIVLFVIPQILIALLIGAIPSIITAIASYKYLSKIIVTPSLPAKTLMVWIFVTILWGAISSFIPAFILFFIFGTSEFPLGPLFLFSLIGTICALFSCLILIAPIKLDHHRQLKEIQPEPSVN